MKSVIVFLKNVWNAQRNAKALQHERENAEHWYQRYIECAEQYLASERYSAALRSQINRRGAGGRFVKKNAS